MVNANVQQILQNNPLKCEILIYTKNGVVSVTEADIIQGGFEVNKASVTNEAIDIGSCVASELSLKLRNYNGKFNDVDFEDAEMYVRVYHNDAFIELGVFVCDEIPRKLSTIEINALDRMILFDKVADISSLQFPCSVSSLVNQICTKCDVILTTDIALLPNSNVRVNGVTAVDSEVSYRTILQSCCIAMGVNGIFNGIGQLELKWYANADCTYDESKRYNSDLYDEDIVITGIYYQDEEENITKVGTMDYALNISSCAIIDDNNVQAIVNGLSNLVGFSYRKFSAEVLPSPFINPMDIVIFKKGDTPYRVPITNVSIALNGSTLIEAKGESKQSRKNSLGSFTQSQAQFINNYAKYEKNKNQALENLNKLIGSSIGLRSTVIDGKYYFYDGFTLANSTIIYTFGSNGFAWTNNWNNGNPTWSYGITKDGNAIINYLQANKITANEVDVDNLFAQNIKATGYIEGMSGKFGKFDIAQHLIGLDVDELYIDNVPIKDVNDPDIVISSNGEIKFTNSHTIKVNLTFDDENDPSFLTIGYLQKASEGGNWHSDYEDAEGNLVGENGQYSGASGKAGYTERETHVDINTISETVSQYHLVYPIRYSFSITLGDIKEAVIKTRSFTSDAISYNIKPTSDTHEKADLTDNSVYMGNDEFVLNYGDSTISMKYDESSIVIDEVNADVLKAEGSKVHPLGLQTKLEGVDINTLTPGEDNGGRSYWCDNACTNLPEQTYGSLEVIGTVQRFTKYSNGASYTRVWACERIVGL